MKRAFTLIELLIVIAIIGILATIVSVNYPSYIKRARDTQRKSDLKQYQVALENYANQHSSVYPISGTIALDSVTPGPVDPEVSVSGYGYKYLSDADGLNYVIWAKLEKPTTGTTSYWISCANGKTGESATAPADTSCSGII